MHPAGTTIAHNRGTMRVAMQTYRRQATQHRAGTLQPQPGQRPISCSVHRASLHGQVTRRQVVAHNQIGDDLLDFIQAGRKMRRWYGQAERPKDGGGPPEEGNEPEPEEEDQGDGDAVLVTEADSPIGEQIVLQLILARANIRVLVKDVAAAKNAYGPYVKPLSFDLGNTAVLKRALRGVGSVVVVGKLGALPQALPSSGVSHVVLLSTVGASGQGGLLGGLFGGSADNGVLGDVQRERQVQSCDVPFSIVRSNFIRQSPGGQANITLMQAEGNGAIKGGAMSCEDLSAVLVATLRRPPSAGRIFQVVNAGPGQRPEEWSPLFAQIKEVATV